jgi:3-oxoacyl-[acyl-carrier protein] reductase
VTSRISLAGRHALITGGSRGIGRATALLFGRLGARVCVNYARDEKAAEQVVATIQAAGGEAFALRADVSDPKQAQFLVEGAMDRLGDLDAVVVNHGIWKRASIDTMTPEQWDETVRTNLSGAYNVCHHAARLMIPKRRGALVLIASTSGQRGEAHYSHYSATKGALLSFTKSLASELAPHGIRVNGVAPGWVVTDMTRPDLEGAGRVEALSAIPLGRAGTPEEIAGPIAFLISDLASYLYGEILSVNGGAVMAD